MQEQQKLFLNFSGFLSSMEKFFTASIAPGTAPVIESEACKSAIACFPTPFEAPLLQITGQFLLCIEAREKKVSLIWNMVLRRFSRNSSLCGVI